jgi:hypothetical protein
MTVPAAPRMMYVMPSSQGHGGFGLYNATEMPSLLSSMYFLELCQFDMTRNHETKSILHLIWVVGKGRLAKADTTFAPPLVGISRGNNPGREPLLRPQLTAAKILGDGI